MRYFVLLLIVTLSGCIKTIDKTLLTERVEAENEFIIANAKVFDGFEFNENMDVWVRDGKILATGNDIAVGLATPVIDAQGKTLIPGLIDMHVHLAAAGSPPWRATLGDIDRTLSANLAVGVTTVMDLGAPLGEISSWENESGSPLPRFAFAGTMFNVKGGHPAPMIEASARWPISYIAKKLLITEISNTEDIVEAIDEHAKEGAKLIKLAIDEIPLGAPTMEVELVSEIVHYAHKKKLKVAAHIGSEENLLVGLAAGVDIFVHGPYRSQFSKDALVKLKSSNTPIVPTTVVFDQLVRFWQGDTQFSALEESVIDPEIKAAYEKRPEELSSGRAIEAWFNHVIKHRQDKFDTLKAMHDAQIPLLLGSDSPNVFTVGGAALHREMALWQKHAGLSSSDILAYATGKSGTWLEEYLGWKVGQIKPGYHADLVLINSDVEDNIENTEFIENVWMGGQKIKPNKAVARVMDN